MSRIFAATPWIFGWKFRPDPARAQSTRNWVKLLKLQILRIDDD